MFFSNILLRIKKELLQNKILKNYFVIAFLKVTIHKLYSFDAYPS